MQKHLFIQEKGIMINTCAILKLFKPSGFKGAMSIITGKKLKILLMNNEEYEVSLTFEEYGLFLKDPEEAILTI